MSAPREPLHPLHGREKKVSEICGQAAVWAVVRAAIVAVLWPPLIGLIAGGIGLVGLVSGAAIAALVVFGVLFLVRLLWLSRTLQDRTFTWFGFFATFFGLGMLVVFFVQLGVEAVAWFRVSPRLIDYQNFLYHERVREAEFALLAKQRDLDAEILATMIADKGQQELYRTHLQGKWGALVAEAEKAAPKEAQLDLAKRWEAYRAADAPDASLRDSLIGDKVKLTLDYLRKTVPSYPKETKNPLDDAVYFSVSERLGELQSVIEKRREAELGTRHEKDPASLFYHFLSENPSNVGQDAGLLPAMLGSLWLALITILLAVPIGVGAALYLEEYRLTGRLARIIQVNINNLAGVPSVVFGILGAYVFVELIFKPMYLEQQQVYRVLAENPEYSTNLWDRLLLWLPTLSARNVLGGGMTLALLTLPIIIVSSQEAIRAVPASIRHGAYALGATQWQTIWHQVLPLARPGILTGTILSLSRAIGEAAPLVLFGTALLVQRAPTPLSTFTVVPMQIFGWADRPGVVVPVENHMQLRVQHVAGTVGFLANPTLPGALTLAAHPHGPGPVLTAHSSVIPTSLPVQTIEIWQHNAAMGSIILLLILLALNGLAIYLRNRAQRRTRL